jgi:hypothetical protein
MILFEVITPLGLKVRTTQAYWEKLVFKHPDVAGKLEAVKETLRHPAEIRRSSRDEFVFLFYQPDNKYWLTVVVKQVSPAEGFLVTCYRTNALKEGEVIWPK